MENVVLKGMIIKNSNVAEYDKRVVILTKERGKIVAFARGARRVKSPLLSGTRLFAFGAFTLYEGKEAYTLDKAEIENYFTEISSDMEAMCYGCYFLEFADYYSRENMEAGELLKLLYQTLRALMNQKIANRLVKCIYELKCMAINGEYPEMFECVGCQSQITRYFSIARGGMLCEKCAQTSAERISPDTSTVYTMQYIISSKIEKLYTFIVKEKVLEELEYLMEKCLKRYIDREFNSLKILNTILK